jgi:hypothetical protein
MPHSDAYRRFQESKNIGYDQWHDGEGYDLDAYAQMTEAERNAAAQSVRDNPNPDWRDLEILGAHGGNESIEHLRGLLLHPSIETRAHALGVLIEHNHTPGAVPDVQLAHIIDAISDDDEHEGITQTLLIAQEHAGPISKVALLRGMLDKPHLALHFADALMNLANLSDDVAAFDPKFRPLLLRLLPENAPGDRQAALNEVCRLLDIDRKSFPAEEHQQRGWAERQWPRV